MASPPLSLRLSDVPWQITGLLVSSVFELVMLFWVRARMQTPAAKPFCLALLLSSSWALGYAIELSVPTLAEKQLVFQIRCTFLCFFAPAWLETVHRLTAGKPLLRGWMIPAVLFVPVLTVGLLWLPGPGEQHALLRHSFWVDTAGGLPVLRNTFGPWGYIHYLYNYAVWLVIFLMLYPRRRHTAWERRGRWIILGSAFFGWTVDLSHLLGLTEPAGLNYAPLFFPLTSAMIAYALWRHRLLNLAPVARAALIEQLDDRILVFDDDTRVVDANAAALATFGRSHGAFLGRRAADLLAAWPELGALFAATDRRPVEVTVEGVVFDATLADVRDEKNAHLRARVLVLRDITRRKEIENQLRQAVEAAVAADQAQSRFLATMSHEIRTPMNGVVGFTQLLQQTPLNREQREYLDLISQSSHSLLVIINDVLDHSKIVADRLEIEQVRCEIAAIVERTCRLLRPLALDKGLELTAWMGESVPAVVIGDPVRLQQILTNLLGNAIKFTERGRVVLEVDALAGGVVVFKVTDTGIGIAADQQARVFKPFSQADVSTTRRFGGTGLGLSITRRLCELMGGSLTLRSELGRGSTFVATIRAAAADTPASGVVATGATSAPVASVRPLRLLVFEDNPINRKVIGQLLARLGHEAQFVENGEQGLAVLETAEFDALLMDLEMPVMDGYEAVRRIRAKEAVAGSVPVHIVALTAHALKEHQDRCLAVGMNDFLTKPVSLAALGEALGRIPRPAGGEASGAAGAAAQ